MYSIFEDSGTQVRARVGDVLELDIRDLGDNADEVTFDRVLVVGEEGSAKIGTPYLDGASVTAKVLAADQKGEKITTIKYKRRKGYRRKIGHRQRHMLVEVTAING